MPEATVRLGVNIRKNVSAQFGYNVLYLNRASRAVGLLNGVAVPAPDVDLVLHGFHVGAECRF